MCRAWTSLSLKETTPDSVFSCQGLATTIFYGPCIDQAFEAFTFYSLALYGRNLDWKEGHMIFPNYSLINDSNQSIFWWASLQGTLNYSFWINHQIEAITLISYLISFNKAWNFDSSFLLVWLKAFAVSRYCCKDSNLHSRS